MFRRDYLVRMVEDMTQMIAKVFSLKAERKTTEALWEIDELLNRHFRLNSRLLNSLSVEDILSMFRIGGTVEADKLQGVARMLREEGGIYGANGQPEEELPRKMKALHLYLAADRHGADAQLLNLKKEIESLLEELSPYRLPAKTERLLPEYYEQTAQYAKAEDSLYRLLESGEEIGPDGEALYMRLLSKSDEELEAGNLPRDEVEQGLQEWRRLAGLRPENGTEAEKLEYAAGKPADEAGTAENELGKLAGGAGSGERGRKAGE